MSKMLFIPYNYLRCENSVIYWKRNTGRSYERRLFSQLSSWFLLLSCKRRHLVKTIVNVIVSFCINDATNVDRKDATTFQCGYSIIK